MHVADGVDMNHQRDKGHYRHHDYSQLVDKKSNLEDKTTGGHPGIDRAIENLQITDQKPVQHVQREYTGHRNRQNGKPMRSGATDLTSKQAGDDGAKQG